MHSPPSTDIKEVCSSVQTTLQQSLQSGGALIKASPISVHSVSVFTEMSQ